MTEHSFSLSPFPAANLPEIRITGHISHPRNLLTLHYSVAGSIADILLPPPSARPGRRNELWKMTCFEFFLAIGGQPQYWEFNLSPSGDWNVYRMDAYRRVGFREETSVQRLPFEVRQQADQVLLDTTVDLRPLFPNGQALAVGITAVIQTQDGNETYWALAHPGSQADFHLRESFILKLAGQSHPSQQSAPGS